jgi:signal transduction histidine kinase
MALAAAETGAIALERRPIGLETYFADIARRCASISETRGIRLRTSRSGLVSTDEVDVDPDRLDQLLLILVDNALNHSPEGSEIELGLAIDRKASAATIAVSDDGPGISPADLERIFEPFERSTGAQRSEGGTGLGLAIARQLALQHGATLEVRSEPGAGATFLLRLLLR